MVNEWGDVEVMHLNNVSTDRTQAGISKQHKTFTSHFDIPLLLACLEYFQY